MMPVKFQGGSTAGSLGELHGTSCCSGYGWGSLSLSASILSLLTSSSWLTIASKGEPPPCTRCWRCRADSWGSGQRPSCCSWSSQAATFLVSSSLYITHDNMEALWNQQLKVRFIITQHPFYQKVLSSKGSIRHKMLRKALSQQNWCAPHYQNVYIEHVYTLIIIHFCCQT